MVLPEFQNLKKLKIVSHNEIGISYESLEEVIRNNPALESLYLIEGFIQNKGICTFYSFDQLMMLVGTHLKHLKKFACVLNRNKLTFDKHRSGQQFLQTISDFVDSLKQLKSLTIDFNVFKIFMF